MYSRYKRQQILHFARMGYKPLTICRMLREEGLIANQMGIHKFYRSTGRRITSREDPVQADQWRWWRLWKHSLSREWGTTMKRPRFSCTLCFYAMATPWLWRQSSGVVLLLAGSFKAVRIVLHRFIQWLIVLWSFLAMNRFRTGHPFRLNGWGVSYNWKGRSIFVSFCKN